LPGRAPGRRHLAGVGGRGHLALDRPPNRRTRRDIGRRVPAKRGDDRQDVTAACQSEQTREEPRDGHGPPRKTGDRSASWHPAPSIAPRHLVCRVDCSEAPGSARAGRAQAKVLFTIDPAANKLVLKAYTHGTTRADSMVFSALFGAACLIAQNKIEAAHGHNAVYSQVLEKGIEAGGQSLQLPAPRLVDGQD